MKSRLAVFVWLFTAISADSCFRPNYVCSYCPSSGICPDGLDCVAGYCVPIYSKQTCVDASVEAAIEVAETSQIETAEVFPDAPTEDVPVGPGDSGDDRNEEDISDGPASTLVCSERCCIGTPCLDFPARLQNGLMLWADRTTLGPVGGTTSTWLDRSPGGRHLTAMPPEFLPRVSRDLTGPVLDVRDSHTQLSTSDEPAFQFGTNDFTILVLARCDSDAEQALLVAKASINRPVRTGIRLFCNHSGLSPESSDSVYGALSVVDEPHLADDRLIVSPDNTRGDLHLFGVRRFKGSQMELRIDGHSHAVLPISASFDFNDGGPIYITSAPLSETYFRGHLAALVVVKGPLEESEVTSLENFLLLTQGKGAPPLQ
jgi:hypothetical protein